MTATALDLDLATLVGELEDVPCENGSHESPEEQDVHGGPAMEYCRVNCPSCGKDVVKAYCGPFMAYVRANRLLRCGMCSRVFSSGAAVTILGPVNGRAS